MNAGRNALAQALMQQQAARGCRSLSLRRGRFRRPRMVARLSGTAYYQERTARGSAGPGACRNSRERFRLGAGPGEYPAARHTNCPDLDPGS